MTSRVWSAEERRRAEAAAGPFLGLDTGTPDASFGIIKNGRVCTSFLRELPSHCAGLPGAVEEALEDADLSFDKLHGIAIGIGPGSFTGLRIGLSYAKGLAVARGLALAGVSSLDAISLCVDGPARPDALVCPLIDARRGEVYAALYRFAGDALERITGDLVVPLTELISRISQSAREVVFAGGAMAAEAEIVARESGLSAVHHAETGGRGGWIAALGAARVASGGGGNIAALEPVYVRAPGIVMKPRSETN